MTPTITQQVRALQSLTPAQLAERYAALFGKRPRTLNKAFLQRQVAWKLQEEELGGLSDRAKSRLAELVAEIDLPIRDGTKPQTPPATARTDSNAPAVGTTLVRRWRDQDIRVEVRAGGFEWCGTIYTSLSAVAKAITGATWNGRLFFGLTQRRNGA